MRILRVQSLSDIAAAWRECTELADVRFARDGRVVSSAMFFPRSRSAYADTIFGDDEVLERTLEAFRLKAIVEDVIAITRVSEAWMVDDLPEPGIRPRDSDNRYEVLTVAAIMRHPAIGKVVSHYGFRRIEHEWDGTAYLTGDWSDSGDSTTCRLLESTLPSRRPNMSERALARFALKLLEPQLRADRQGA